MYGALKRVWLDVNRLSNWKIFVVYQRFSLCAKRRTGTGGKLKTN